MFCKDTKIKNRKAVTLIEVLVASAILAFVLIGVTMFISVNDRLNKEGLLEAFLQTNLDLVLKQIGNDVRNGATMEVTGTKKLVVKAKDGSVTSTWEYNSETHKISRNAVVQETKGATGEYDCEFRVTGGNILNLSLKLTLKNGEQYQTSTGTDFLSFIYVCRNVTATVTT